MKFFKRRNKDNGDREIKYEKKYYNLADLEQKVRTKTPMTSDEFNALQRERTKDVLNKILRVFGVAALLFVVVLAIGAFLYPYSLLNLFGEGDKFWDCWNHIQYHLPAGDIMIIYDDPAEALNHIDSNGACGWTSITEMMRVAFRAGTSGKLNFLVLGTWSIILVATIGLIAVIIFAAYITAYNIKDLILVIRHFGRQGVAVISDVALTAAESVEEGTKDKNKSKKQVKKAPAKKKTMEKNLFSEDEPSNVDNIKENKKETADEVKPEERRKEEGEISPEDLDRLLLGEDIKK